MRYAGLSNTKQISYESDRTGSGHPTTGATHQPWKVVSPSGDWVEFDYQTGSGRVDKRRTYKTGTSNPEESVQFTYTLMDAVDSVKDLIADAASPGTGLTDYEYDTAGRLTGVQFPTGSLSGAHLGYAPDILGRIKQVKVKPSNAAGAKEYIIEYGYHLNGQIETIKLFDPTAAPNTVLHTTTFTYDAVGRVSMRTHTMSGVTPPTSRYFYKTPVASVAPDSWTEWAANDLVTHIEHSRGSVLITRLTYERLPGGEPQKIWYNEATTGNWNGVTSETETVTMNYVNGLRLGGEDWATQADLAYTYNDAGSRLTRTVAATAISTATYKAGFQINGVTGTGGAVNETWAYDSGGRVTTLNRGVNRSCTWTAADQLKTAAVNGTTTTYKYDPMGRRTDAAKTGQTRRFIIGPTADTGLEVIHAVVDASGNVEALYVYTGDQPIVRFTVDGNGKPVNPVYYLEDAHGSVVGLTDAPMRGVAQRGSVMTPLAWRG